MSEQYIVSARKYRPDTFASIVGQGAMSTTLKTAVLGGRMAHAYLFCGPRGVGKTTAARVLAKTINCLELSPEGEACNACESCRAFNEGRSFNIFELDAASNNSVEDIRSLTEQVMIAPVLGKYKVYIIDEVHMLSQAAFNAFLKTLEEPPSYAIFILATTEKHKILPTILSRCQTYDFKRITVMDIARHLRYVADSEGITAEDTALGLIAEKADGGMRDALSMFDRVASFGQGAISYQMALDCLNILDHNYYIRFIQGFVSGDYRGLLLTLDEVLGRGFDGQLVMSGLASFARDLLVVQHADTMSLLEKPESVQQLYAETARIVAPSALHQIIRMLVGADAQWRASSNKRLLIELTFLNILSAFQPNALEIASAEPQPQLVQRSVPVAPVPQASVVAPAPSPAVAVPTPPAPASPPVASPRIEEVQAPAQPMVAPSPQPTPTVASEAPPTRAIAASDIPSQQREGLQTRQRFRNRRSVEKSEESQAPLVEQDTPYTEADVQHAWLLFLSERLGEEQVYMRNALSDTLPRLVAEHRVSLPLINSSTVLAPMQELLPQAQRYIQEKLQNTKVQLAIELRAVEQSYQPTTNREKYEALEKEYPILESLRQQLNLRVT